MNSEMTEDELRALAEQLGHPHGEMGLAVGEQLHKSNASMTLNTFQSLGLSGGDHLLEMGHGTCAHLPDLFSQCPDITYCGLEISELMLSESKRLNQPYVDSELASFFQFDGTRFPFSDHQFDAVMTVNTIYFWPEPVETLSEIRRVLKPGAKLSIGFGQKSCMQELPFVPYGFRLYSSDDLHELLSDNGFGNIAHKDYNEFVENKLGGDAPVERQYTVMSSVKLR